MTVSNENQTSPPVKPLKIDIFRDATIAHISGFVSEFSVAYALDNPVPNTTPMPEDSSATDLPIKNTFPEKSNNKA